MPSPEEKAHELVCAFVGDADIVWSAAGGDGAIDIVNVLDFAQIGKPLNKLYIGFSDSCSICYALATQCDMPSIYGHNVKGMADIKEDRLDVLDMIAGKKCFSTYDWWENVKTGIVKPPIEAYHYSAPIKGRMIGGLVENMVAICGTTADQTSAFIDRHPDAILFLEAYQVSPANLQVHLNKLEQAGWLEKMSGFVVARSYNYYNPTKMAQANEVWKQYLLKFGKPVFLNVDISHMYPTIPIFYNKSAKISFDSGRLFFEYQR